MIRLPRFNASQSSHQPGLVAVFVIACLVPALVARAQEFPGQLDAESFRFSLVQPVAYLAAPQGEDVVKDGAANPGQSTPSANLNFPGIDPSSNVPVLDSSSAFETPAVASPNRPYFYSFHRGGENAGYKHPFTGLAFFQPLELDNGIVFGTSQLLMDNDGNPGGSFGIGRRFYSPSSNRVTGIGLAYDIRESQSQHLFQQVVLSAENRGSRNSFFANVYLPIGSRQAAMGLNLPGPLRFQDNHLVQERLDLVESQMEGFDLDFATRLSDDFNVWLSGGGYQLRGGGESTWGGTGKLYGYLTSRSAFEVQVTEDSLYGTSFGFSIALFLGGNRDFSQNTVQNMLREPVRRRESVALLESVFVADRHVLTQGGNPLTFAHVNDSGIGNGTGVANDPLGSLVDADASVADVVIVHAGSHFNGQGITLANGQSLIGEGDGIQNQIVTDQLGLTNLPRASTGANRPVIENAPVNAVALASNSNVSGLVIINPANVGIVGDNTVGGNVAIDSVSITGGTTGIQLKGANANFQLSSFDTSNSGSGVLLNNLSGVVLIDSATMENHGGHAIQSTNVNVLAIRNLTARNNAGSPLLVQVGGTNTSNVTVRDSFFTGNGNQLDIDFLVNAGATINLNLFNTEDSLGFRLERDAAGQLNLGGTIGQGGFFNNDNGNIANNGNTTLSGAPVVTIIGAGNQIGIIDPASIPGF